MSGKRSDQKKLISGFLEDTGKDLGSRDMENMEISDRGPETTRIMEGIGQDFVSRRARYQGTYLLMLAGSSVPELLVLPRYTVAQRGLCVVGKWSGKYILGSNT